MKKNDWILTAGTAIYSYLFYKQSFGINFLLFSIAMIVLLLIRNREVLKNRNWIFAAAGTLLSASCIAYYGNGLSFIANIISLAILSAYSFYPQTSVITSLFFSMYSILASYVFVILDAINRNQNKLEKSEGRSSGVKFLLYAIPFLIVMVFFFMYKASNPIFDNFTKKINLDFISLGWLLFTFGGFFLIYGFLYHKRIKAIANIDELAPNTLSLELVQNKKTFLKLGIDNEKLSGVILLLMLNILLLTVNALDATFLFSGTLPKDLNYSSFVHQGTGMLIISIIVAILIIIYYFRGELNFYKGNRGLKLLGFLWIAQNAFMIISTAYRNNLYINEYSLTYKRIGVYIWLLLAMIGLLTTFVKIYKAKSNWFLFRSNGWLFYTVLVISPLVNWDVMVSDFNIHQAEQKHRPLDKSYLISLSEKNLPQLLQLSDEIRDSTSVDDFDESSLLSRADYSWAFDFKPALCNKLYHFMDEMQQQEWKSYCVDKSRVYNEIEAISNNIQEITLRNNYLGKLKPLSMFTNLRRLHFTNDYLRDLGELKLFPKLEELNLTYDQIDSIDFFPEMKSLKMLTLLNNNIKKLYPLKNAPNLVFLDISSNPQVDLRTMPIFKNLNTLYANNVPINEFSPIKHMLELKVLSLSNSVVNNKNALPVLPHLEKLTLQNNQIVCHDTALFDRLASYCSLTYLNLADNQMSDLYPLTSYYDVKKTWAERSRLLPRILSLKSLDVSRNNFHSIYPLLQYKNLEELYVDGNTLTDVISMESFTKLRLLSMNNCGLRNINFLKNLKTLEELYVGSNDIIDISPLYELKSLKKLMIKSVTKAQEKKLKDKFPGLEIISNITN